MKSPLYIEITDTRKVLEIFDTIREQLLDAHIQIRHIQKLRSEEEHMVQELQEGIVRMRERMKRMNEGMNL